MRECSKKRARSSKLVLAIIGVTAGMLCGLFGVGALLAAYVSRVTENDESFKANISAVFIVDNTFRIPYGKTATYGWIAEQIAKERGIDRMSAQAVGGAVGHNPICIIVPCHRVVGAKMYGRYNHMRSGCVLYDEASPVPENIGIILSIRSRSKVNIL